VRREWRRICVKQAYGKTAVGSQRYRCFQCKHSYTPKKKEHGQSKELRQEAIRHYVDGMNLRRTRRQLGIHHQTVANWAKEYAEKLPDAPVPEKVQTAELDELITFIGDKKKRIYIVTMVDRDSHCILGWKVIWDRTQEAIQAIVDKVPKAKWYFSDGLGVYHLLWYHFGRYEVSEGKSDTYSVEADNAEMRHYLARLARSSRCFSRCPYALHCAPCVFDYCYCQHPKFSTIGK
jgi:IS1 family transposase